LAPEVSVNLFQVGPGISEGKILREFLISNNCRNWNIWNLHLITLRTILCYHA